MKLQYFLAAAAIAFGCPADADTITIHQAGKKFSEKRLELKVGDVIEFVNDDTNVHNVHSMSEGNEFDLGAQSPGDTQSIALDARGKIKIRCAIHPRMKLTVTVE